MCHQSAERPEIPADSLRGRPRRSRPPIPVRRRACAGPHGGVSGTIRPVKRGRVLIISDGGTAALLAAAAAADRSVGRPAEPGAVMWGSWSEPSAADLLRGPIERQGELFGFSTVFDADAAVAGAHRD